METLAITINIWLAVVVIVTSLDKSIKEARDTICLNLKPPSEEKDTRL